MEDLYNIYGTTNLVKIQEQIEKKYKESTILKFEKNVEAPFQIPFRVAKNGQIIGVTDPIDRTCTRSSRGRTTAGLLALLARDCCAGHLVPDLHTLNILLLQSIFIAAQNPIKK